MIQGDCDFSRHPKFKEIVELGILRSQVISMTGIGDFDFFYGSDK